MKWCTSETSTIVNSYTVLKVKNFVLYRFTDLMKKLKKNIDEAVSQLVNNFEVEFGSGRISQETGWVENSKPIPGLEDEEVSSFHSIFEQVRASALLSSAVLNTTQFLLEMLQSSLQLKIMCCLDYVKYDENLKTAYFHQGGADSSCSLTCCF